VAKLVELVEQGKSRAGSRYSTPAPSIPQISKPKGSAGRSGDSRAGYNLQNELMLSNDQYSKLRVSAFNVIYYAFDASNTSIVDG